MKYILIIGIEYKKYLRPVNLTIQIGNTFIDSFELERDYPSTNDVRQAIGKPWFEKMLASIDNKNIRKELSYLWSGSVEPLPTFYKVYALDDHDLEGYLSINVENDNNNYTNGFMTHNSLVKLKIASLIPMNLIKNNGEDLCKIVCRLDRSFMKFVRKNSINTDHRIAPLNGQVWPHHADFFEVKRKDETYEKNGVKDCNLWLGGSFVARFPICVRHKIKYLSRPGAKNIGLLQTMIDVRVLLCSWLSNKLNIYNEDQRSNNAKN